MTKIVLRNECYKDKDILDTVNLNNVEYSEQNMNKAFKNCINLKRVFNIDSKITTLNEAFSGCTNLKEDIVIESREILSCSDVFANNTYAKKVYIHYYDENTGNATNTYNTFRDAGYDEIGSKDAIYLDNIDDPNDITINRYNAHDNYSSKYGFKTDDGTIALSLGINQNEEYKPARVNFYNTNSEMIDYFYMPNNGDITGTNAADWQPLLGCVGLDVPTTNGYSTYKSTRFFKYNDKYWAYYLNLPFSIWYSFLKNGEIYCLPISPWQNVLTTLNVYKQTDQNTFTSGTNSANTNYCYPIYFSHTNNKIYALYMEESGGTNNKYMINLDDNYNITSKTSNFTISGESFSVYWYSDYVTPIRELNSDFTPGNIQITRVLGPYEASPRVVNWYVLSETSNGTLNCNTTRNNNLRNYFRICFDNNINNVDKVYALPGSYFLVKGNIGSTSKIYKFHFNGNKIVDDGLYLTIPNHYNGPSNGYPIFVNYLQKEIGWTFCKDDKAEYIVVTRKFDATENLPIFRNENTSITVNDAIYRSSQDADGIVHLFYIQRNQEDVTIINPTVPMSVKLQFRNVETGVIINNSLDDHIIPYVNFEGAIATRNMFEYLVPSAGMYTIGFTADPSGKNQYLPAETKQYGVTNDNQVIIIDLVPIPDLPDKPFEGELKSWYYSPDDIEYYRINNRNQLLTDLTVNNEFTCLLPWPQEFIIGPSNTLIINENEYAPDNIADTVKLFAYNLYCYGENYYIFKHKPRTGDHVFEFNIDANNTTCTQIATISETETAENGKAYIDNDNKLHINGVGVFSYNENKSALIILS